MNYNRVIIAGRVTRDVEMRSVGQHRVGKFGMACNNRKKDQSGTWVNDPMFIDCEAWNKTAEIIEQYAGKGAALLVEGRLKLEQWDDKTTGAKRSKHLLMVDAVQLGAKPTDEHDQRTPASESDDGGSQGSETFPF